MNDIKEYYAHSKKDVEKYLWQTLKVHSENVGEFVKLSSQEWCSEDFAYNLGILHDIGKYQEEFQKRLDGYNIAVEHSICGAVECDKYNMTSLGQYCIAGHHSGLPDYGNKMNTADDSTLLGRLKRTSSDYSNYNTQLSPVFIRENPIKVSLQVGEQCAKQLAFWTRMMFSCLTDADFLDTEKFMNGQQERGVYTDFSDCLDKLKAHMQTFAADTDVKKARNILLNQISDNVNKSNNISLLNMPTGSGKTLASMRLALERAIKTHKKHIIYVIPFTSIIEQNSRVFKDIFGNESVLEHHSNFNYDNVENTDIVQKLKKSAENWDASIIVTTTVQFFESVYGNHSSQLRKLHNIADSILIFDEIHMLPALFYQPCLESIKMLVKDYNCEAIFLTATMPNYHLWLDKFGCGEMKVSDLISDRTCFSTFKRCKIKNLGEVSFDYILERLVNNNKSNLIVVNTRSNAKKIYQSLSGLKYHLSTYMTALDRSKVIEAVKKALDENKKFCLVSTSLIEAGVDIDFDCAFRETAGLDNLLQTAGRCNREGKKENCTTYAFTFENIEMQSKDPHLQNKKFICEQILSRYDDVTSTEAINEYFDKIYTLYKSEMDSMNFKNFIKLSSKGYQYDFATYAEKFKVIDDNSRSIVIIYPNDEFEKGLLDNLKYGDKNIKRSLQKYCVSVKNYEYIKLMELGVIVNINGIDCLGNYNYYDKDTGIKFDDTNDYNY